LSEYLEIDIRLPLKENRESFQEQVLAMLADSGFDGFREEDGRILAYLPSGSFSDEDFRDLLSMNGLDGLLGSYTVNSLPERNWNEEWEKNYPPVQVSGNCLVRAPFHAVPGDIEFDLLISPGMTFGTAHHETTRLMMEVMLETEWDGMKVLDMGCGTGVLAILAEKMGATEVLAIDNDKRACLNAEENAELNGCRNIRIRHGDPVSLGEFAFDAVLANINLNVLLGEMENLSTCLSLNGLALLSGFYRHDLEKLDAEAKKHGLFISSERTLNQWTVAVYRKAD
jgi:ribosomal protein L11 methyltransferase